MRRCLAAILLAALLLSSVAARAGQAMRQPEVVGVRVGFGGCYKAGLWTPVEVTLRGGDKAQSGSVSVIVPDCEGVPSRVVTSPDRPVSLRPGQEASVTLCVRFGRVSSELKVEFQVEGRVVAEKTFAASAEAGENRFPKAIESRALVVCVGDVAKTVEEAAALGESDVRRRPVVVRVDGPEQLPANWYGYEGVDALVLATSKPGLYEKLSPAGSQIEALDQWVQMGGKLVLCMGAQAPQLAGKDSALARFMPGRFQEAVSLRQTAALENYAGSSTPVPLSGNGDAAPLQAVRLTGVQGIVEAREADLPLVVRTGRGFGQVMFLAVDLDAPALRQWNDDSVLAARLLGLPTTRAEQVGEETSGGMTFGYTDMAGQLRSSLDQFAGVSLVPFWLLAVLIIVYILLIGPGDYFFLRRIAGHMQWTWLTFPVIVAVFGVGAYVAAYRLKGTELRVNQIDLMDVDAASGRIRGTSWMNVFSPRTELFDLSVQPRLPSGKSGEHLAEPVAWLGLPGRALGGMDPAAASSIVASGQYEFSPALDVMRGVPIQVWSTRSFTARWRGETQTTGIEANLNEEEQRLSGVITNNLGFPLSKCVLAYDRWAYELETLQPGQQVELGSMKCSELRTLLTGRKMMLEKGKDSYRQETTVYDQSSSDAPYVLRMMMFYEAAGGRRYTGLANDYQRFVDLSEVLKTGRAILIGQAPDATRDARGGAQLRRDDRTIGDGPQDRHALVYRFVLPVKKDNK